MNYGLFLKALLLIALWWSVACMPVVSAVAISDGVYNIDSSALAAGGIASTSGALHLHSVSGQAVAMGESGGGRYHVSPGFLATTPNNTLVLLDTTAPVISLLGGNVSVNQGAVYGEPGFSASDNIDGDISANVLVSGGPVNTSAAVGSIFTLTYTVSDTAGNVANPKTRIVTITALPIVDSTAPVITMLGSNATVIQGQVYRDSGATAWDNMDGDVSANIIVTSTVNTSVIGSYRVSYDVRDQAGNAAVTKIRIVQVIADLPPAITMLGSNLVALVEGGFYNDGGATAIDDVDGDVSANIVTLNQVNTAVAGVYRVTYNVRDQAGNIAIEAVRTVKVIARGGAADRNMPVQLPLTGAAASVNVASSGEIISNFSSTPSRGTPPNGMRTPFGVLSYTTTVPAGSRTQTIQLSFSTALPAGFEVYKVDVAGVYLVVPNGTSADQWVQVDASTIALTLSDGGRFDEDGVVNGVIVDPLAIAVPVTAQPGNTSAGGGGCSMHKGSQFDPVLVLLLLLSLRYFIRSKC